MKNLIENKVLAIVAVVFAIAFLQVVLGYYAGKSLAGLESKELSRGQSLAQLN